MATPFALTSKKVEKRFPWSPRVITKMKKSRKDGKFGLTSPQHFQLPVEDHFAQRRQLTVEHNATISDTQLGTTFIKAHTTKGSRCATSRCCRIATLVCLGEPFMCIRIWLSSVAAASLRNERSATSTFELPPSFHFDTPTCCPVSDAADRLLPCRQSVRQHFRQKDQLAPYFF